MDAGLRFVVAPRLKGRIHREEPIGPFGRFIHEGSQIHHHARLPYMRRGGRPAVQGVAVMHEEHVCRTKRGKKPLQIGFSSGVAEGMAAGKIDGLTDPAGSVIQQGHGTSGLVSRPGRPLPAVRPVRRWPRRW